MYTNLNEETAVVVVVKSCCTVWEHVIFMIHRFNSQSFTSSV